VTPAAVYRHFEGARTSSPRRPREGFEMFADLLEHAWEKGPALGARVLRGDRTGLPRLRAQVPRALRGDVRVGPAREPHARAVGPRRAPCRLWSGPRATCRPTCPPSAARRLPWSGRMSGPLARRCRALRARCSGADALSPPEDLLETGIGIYLRGLGLIPPDS
jgi:hypothetical protein